jgi:2-amino-4-hydroxy-6-hydroxymethyldihydropteridine diphosphokinase
MLHNVYLALGSNVGDRLRNLRSVLHALPTQVKPVECSPIYETEPWGFLDQPTFLNQVIKATTELTPEDLLHYTKGIEVHLGRKPTIKYGPRLIDIDILFYDDLILSTDSLEIPHPLISERAFVLVPLADLDPELEHPILKSSIGQLVSGVDKSGVSWYAMGECGKMNNT